MASLSSQVAAVTVNNLRSLPQRWSLSAVIVIGIAVTVAVLVSVLAMATGFGRTLANTGRADRALVLRGGSQSELASTLSRDNALTILDAHGVRKGAAGKPIASAEMVAMLNLRQKNTGTKANVALRGVGPQGFELRPEIHIVAGRMFRPAVRELIVGRSAQMQFEGLDLGQRLTFHDGEWTIVGVFDSGGDSHESEMMADAETVLSAYRRNLFQSVTVQLDSAAGFDAFKDQLTTNPTLSVDVKRETGYYAEQSRQLSKLLFFVAYIVGGIMALGAVFGALNTLYSAVAARSLEIATLRAIGFGPLPVVVSVFAESLLLSLIGGCLGAAIAWVFFNGNSVNTLGSNFTQVVFRLTVTPALAMSGVVMACIVGLVGGLFPAIRAARLPIAQALRAG
ncbi:MAG: ABC transporter permease [Steroidobacteraceae bacterium]